MSASAILPLPLDSLPLYTDEAVSLKIVEPIDADDAVSLEMVVSFDATLYSLSLSFELIFATDLPVFLILFILPFSKPILSIVYDALCTQ